jgi:hypothetical protein
MASETFLFALLSMPVAAVRMVVVRGDTGIEEGGGNLNGGLLNRHFKSGQRAFKYKSKTYTSSIRNKSLSRHRYE